MEEVESRFLHLLQPIRDLTKNWEVDVAAQLEEYLVGLDQICISFDDGKTTMNFIEAALVIQGSACVYSRKVEYLYSLVYQTLDFISNKKREKLPSSMGQDGRDADATFGAEEQEEFLSLDDIRDSSQANVDMGKDHQPNAVDIVPLTPMSLVLPEEAEKRDNPLFSRKGEVLASRRDFRMNTCTPHTTGAFLLELAGLSPTGLQERQRVGSPGRAAGTGRSGCSGTDGGSGDPVQALSFSEDAVFYAPVALPGAAGADEDDAPGAPEDDMEMVPAAQERIEAQRSAPRPRGYMLRERAPAEEPPAHIKEMLDPWQSLDPFADSEDKPFKKGRPFLVPHGLDDVVGGKRKRKVPRKLQDFMKWFSAAYNDVADSRKARRKGPTSAGPLLCRGAGGQGAGFRSGGGTGGRAGVAPAAPKLHEGSPGGGQAGGGLVDPGGALSGSPLPADDFAEREDVQPEAPEELGEGDLGLPDPGSLRYEELVRRNVELFMANSQKYAQETELSQHIRHWEDRMGPLLQEQ
ncbi:CNDH2 protein, partial [Rhinoptilus africanus]|nr:CNDH2 protein [Rhinoptilus africanus]